MEKIDPLLRQTLKGRNIKKRSIIKEANLAIAELKLISNNLQQVAKTFWESIANSTIAALCLILATSAIAAIVFSS